MKHHKLTDRELKVMLAIMRCRKDSHAPKIGEVLTEFTGEVLSLGALHSALDRLEGRGMIDAEMGEATKERGGKRKRHFTVNGEGQIAVQHALSVVGAMAEGLGFGDDAGGEVLV